MNVFEPHRNVIADYEKYIRSFIRIADPEIQKVVDAELSRGKLWPEPLLQFNPAFKSAGKVSDLATDGTVHSQVADVFKGYSLYQHQLDAIRLGAAGKDFVVTSGTGSAFRESAARRSGGSTCALSPSASDALAGRYDHDLQLGLRT